MIDSPMRSQHAEPQHFCHTALQLSHQCGTGGHVGMRTRLDAIASCCRVSYMVNSLETKPKQQA
jgi:hypothetical protein